MACRSLTVTPSVPNEGMLKHHKFWFGRLPVAHDATADCAHLVESPKINLGRLRLLTIQVEVAHGGYERFTIFHNHPLCYQKHNMTKARRGRARLSPVFESGKPIVY